MLYLIALGSNQRHQRLGLGLGHGIQPHTGGMGPDRGHADARCDFFPFHPGLLLGDQDERGHVFLGHQCGHVQIVLHVVLQ